MTVVVLELVVGDSLAGLTGEGGIGGGAEID